MKTKKTKKPLQENVAPKGYIAVEIHRDPKKAIYHFDPKNDICSGCAFEKEDQCGMDRPCCVGERDDGRVVIFKKLP